MPKAIYISKAIPIKFPTAFFTEVEKTLLKFIKTTKDPEQPEQNKAGGSTPPNFKLYYEAIVIKTIQHWHKNRQIDQWNKIKSTEIDSRIYGQPVFDCGAKNTQ